MDKDRGTDTDKDKVTDRGTDMGTDINIETDIDIVYFRFSLDYCAVSVCCDCLLLQLIFLLL